MKRIGLSFALAVGLFAGVSTIDTPDAVAQSSTTGAVRGRIVDQKSKDAVIGATVSITGPALQGAQSEITDENGSFQITNLPPGTYVLTVFYGDSKFNRPNVTVEVGKQAFLSVPIDTEIKAEVIELVGRNPIVDQGSTKVGSTITEEYTRNIPVGRTFGAVLGTAPGSQGDAYGVSFSGSTSVESSYVVEGINTTDTAFGGQSTNLPNEFVEETEAIAGGYAAEFGRSTGGVINVVTKQGGNKFKGSVFGYFTPGNLVADSDAVLSAGSALGSETNLDYAADLGFELGGPIIKDKVWFHVGYNPSFGKDTLDRITSTRVDRNDLNGSGVGDPISGFNTAGNGIDACERARDMTANGGNGDGILDANEAIAGDCVADVDADTNIVLLEEVARQSRARFRQTHFFTAKINAAISEQHQIQVSGFGNPRTFDRDFYRITGAPESMLYKSKDGAYDVAVKWTSKFNNGKTQIDAVGGYHLGYETQDPYFAGGDAAAGMRYQFNDSGLPFNLSDFKTHESIYNEACTDGGATDPFPGMANCPVASYTTNGLGFLETRDNARTSGVVSLTQRFQALGHHAVKVGGDFELTTYDSTRTYTGKAFYDYIVGWERRASLNPDEPGNIPCLTGVMCSLADSVQADTKNRNLGAYAQDSWQIRPNFTVNAGVRWERQTAYVAEGFPGKISSEGEKIPEVAFDINNMIAPRLGFIWDPTSEGRAKLMAHVGRFYESVPMDINIRAFGGEITDFSLPSATDCPEVDIDATQTILEGCQTYDPNGQLGGGTEYVAPSMKGQYINELILGAEYELMPDFKMGVNFVGRTLPRIIEDMSVDNGTNYFIGNPGEDFSGDAADLRAAAMAATDPRLVTLYNNRADYLDAVSKFDKPSRDYQAIQITGQQRFSKNAMLLASYTYARSKGNFPGLFSTETNQLDPNLTSMYDLPELMSNRYGVLGLDRPHSLKVDGFYQFDMKKAGLVTVGGSFRGQSGLAHNTLGRHWLYGADESYLLPRGSANRSPFVMSTDVKLTYGRRISKSQTIELFADVFNLFNSQEEVDADERFTTDRADPIVGGDLTDLAHAKVLRGSNATNSRAARLTGPTLTANKNYGNLSARQAPRSLRFGLRYSF